MGNKSRETDKKKVKRKRGKKFVYNAPSQAAADIYTKKANPFEAKSKVKHMKPISKVLLIYLIILSALKC